MYVIAKSSMVTRIEDTSSVLRETDKNGVSREELVNSV